MTETGHTNPHILGLTGSFGSGCSYVAQHILGKMDYRVLSLSEALREEYRAAHDPKAETIPRRELQRFGDESRKSHGPQWLATKARARVSAGPEQAWVVDSVRNPAEIYCLREYSRNFFLFGVYATKDRRWQRSKEIYRGNLQEFDEDDERDTGRRSERFGQRVEDCFAEADVVIANDEDFSAVDNEPFRRLRGRIESYVELVSKPLSRRQPTQAESLTAAAYTVSQRSSCLKRKVGAVIVDDEGNIISSGFNEVPRNDRPCVEEFGKCGRERDWERLREVLSEQFPQENLGALLDRVRREVRMLDHCRALHAEENAIINLARNGRSVPLKECTLYTTTYLVCCDALALLTEHVDIPTRFFYNINVN